MAEETPSLSRSGPSRSQEESNPQAVVHRSRPGGLIVELKGDWVLSAAVPEPAEVSALICKDTDVRQVRFDSQALRHWDSGLLTFLLKLRTTCGAEGIDVSWNGLPEGVARLVDLATAVPEKEGARRGSGRTPILATVGTRALRAWSDMHAFVAFLGEATLSFGRFFTGRARFRSSDLWVIIQDTGARALPIVSLISVLVGLILAFVGAIQLAQFGAQIFVANLVGIGMAREMGAMMTAIIMAGRTGAAFAAQLGTMQVNEEIDALETFGIPAVDFLVLPRMLALILMMPLLALYSILLGMLGGAIVGIGMLDISSTQYINQTISSLTLVDFAVGLVKAAVFGVLIAVAGCLRGLQCGRSASAVGEAATSAVVTAIVLIVVTDGLFAVVTNVVGI